MQQVQKLKRMSHQLKEDWIVFLAKLGKLNIIEALISKDWTDSYISYDKLVLVNNVSKRV